MLYISLMRISTLLQLWGKGINWRAEPIPEMFQNVVNSVKIVTYCGAASAEGWSCPNRLDATDFDSARLHNRSEFASEIEQGKDIW
jgi:hypothetical protein